MRGQILFQDFTEIDLGRSGRGSVIVRQIKMSQPFSKHEESSPGLFRSR